VSDRVDTLRADLARLDRSIRNAENAWLDFLLTDAETLASNLGSLRAFRELLVRELEEAIAREADYEGNTA
jgi:hypothetical protein